VIGAAVIGAAVIGSAVGVPIAAPGAPAGATATGARAAALFGIFRHDTGGLAWDSLRSVGGKTRSAGARATAGSALTFWVGFLTERGRFELPLPLRADRFSKPAHSTTLPPLRGAGEVYAEGNSASKPVVTAARVGCAAIACGEFHNGLGNARFVASGTRIGEKKLGLSLALAGRGRSIVHDWAARNSWRTGVGLPIWALKLSIR
jgi:hypothetical protein